MLLRAGEFLGSALRVHDWGGLTVSEHAYAAHALLPEHEHRRAYLSIPMSGSYEERWGERRTSCSSATASSILRESSTPTSSTEQGRAC
jgi:hypothetical protein